MKQQPDEERKFVRQYQRKKKLIEKHPKPEITEWAVVNARWDSHLNVICPLPPL
jgi:hypothetical protein